METTETTESILSKRDAARIWRALMHMPYGSGLTPKLDDIDVETVVTYLESFGERLRAYADEHQRRDEELERHRNLIRGGRRLLAELLDKS